MRTIRKRIYPAILGFIFVIGCVMFIYMPETIEAQLNADFTINSIGLLICCMSSLKLQETSLYRYLKIHGL